jgi:class 3 adenylate cyclase
VGDQAWVALLAKHDAVVDQELRRFRGRKVNTMGDGVVATFDGPARAVRCAAAISISLRDLGLEIRAGLHAGEIEHRGSDVGGIAVHVASRISSLAGAGQILVSRTVTDLALGSGIEFDHCGEQGLKGVPGSWSLFAAKV